MTADLHAALRLVLEGIEAGTARFMSDYERAGDGISRRISGEAAAMIVAERSQITGELRAVLAGHTPPSETDPAAVGAAIERLGEAAHDRGDQHAYRHALAALRAGDSTACTDERCHLDVAVDVVEQEIRMFANSRGTWKPRELADHLATCVLPPRGA